MDLGVRQAGWEIRVMVEMDRCACETLRCNWTREGIRKCHNGRKPSWFQKREPVILERDITTLPSSEILKAAGLMVGEPGLVMGGFPCQGFSTSNSNRSESDPRNRLYLECVRVVRETLPRYFVFENVPGLVSMGKGRVIDTICHDLAGVGYSVHWDILNAADFGVPQRRRRVFFIGQRQDLLWSDGKKMSFHMACGGEVHHPESFLKKNPQYREKNNVVTEAMG